MSYIRNVQATPENRSRLSERIADELQAEIIRDGFVADRRLPTEAALMERYGVSRTVVREAAKLLVQRGLVTVAPGRGMVVAAFDGRQIAEQFSLVMMASDGTFEQLLELRLALEVQVATAAARSATDEQLAGLRVAIDDGCRAAPEPDERARTDVEAFLDADLRFHELLAESSGNPFFDLVCRPINTFLRSHYLERDHYPSDPARTLAEHEEILAALEDGDTFRARQACEEHLRRLLRNSYARTGAAPAPSVRHLHHEPSRRGNDEGDPAEQVATV